MISNDINFWIRIIKTNNILELAKEKKCFIWGGYSKGAEISNYLEKNGLEINGFIDSFKNGVDYCGKKVFSPDYLMKLNYKPYIFIAIEGVRNEIVSWLLNNNFKNVIDFFYFSMETPEIELSSIRGSYKDCYGNSFKYDDTLPSKDIIIQSVGGKNEVSIGENLIVTNGKLIIHASYGSKIMIGKNVKINGNFTINAYFGGIVLIGEGFTGDDGSVVCSTYNAMVEIGKKTSTGKRFYVSAGKNSPVRIGFDCMISHDVSIHGTNEHSIFDLEKKESISQKKEQPIYIADHVWLGKNSTILYGTSIGNGSIVGACSLCSGVYPEKSIIAGNIAKIIRNNCTWDRRKDISIEELQSN